MRRSAVRAFVALDIRDQIRDRSAIFSRLGPTLFILLGIAFALLSSIGDDRSLEDRRTLAVPEGVDLPVRLLVALEEAELDLAPVRSVHTAVREGEAAAGLEWDATEVTVVDRSGDDASALTARRARQALAAWDLERNPTPTEIPLGETEIEPTVTKVRQMLSLLLPGAMLTLLGAGFGNSAMQWHETHRSGALAHQLSLPIRRHQLLLAKTIAEATLSLAALSPFVLLLAAGVFGVVTTDVGAAGGIAAVALLAAVAVLTTAAYAIGGLLIVLRRPERATQGTMTFAPLLLGTGAVFGHLLTEGDVPGWLALVPLIGPTDVLRTAVGGSFEPSLLVGSVATTSIAAALLLRAALAASTDDLGMRPR